MGTEFQVGDFVYLKDRGNFIVGNVSDDLYDLKYTGNSRFYAVLGARPEDLTLTEKFGGTRKANLEERVEKLEKTVYGSEKGEVVHGDHVKIHVPYSRTMARDDYYGEGKVVSVAGETVTVRESTGVSNYWYGWLTKVEQPVEPKYNKGDTIRNKASHFEYVVSESNLNKATGYFEYKFEDYTTYGWFPEGAFELVKRKQVEEPYRFGMGQYVRYVGDDRRFRNEVGIISGRSRTAFNNTETYSVTLSNGDEVKVLAKELIKSVPNKFKVGDWVSPNWTGNSAFEVVEVGYVDGVDSIKLKEPQGSKPIDTWFSTSSYVKVEKPFEFNIGDEVIWGGDESIRYKVKERRRAGLKEEYQFEGYPFLGFYESRNLELAPPKVEHKFKVGDVVRFPTDRSEYMHVVKELSGKTSYKAKLGTYDFWTDVYDCVLVPEQDRWDDVKVLDVKLGNKVTFIGEIGTVVGIKYAVGDKDHVYLMGEVSNGALANRKVRTTGTVPVRKKIDGE